MIAKPLVLPTALSVALLLTAGVSATPLRVHAPAEFADAVAEADAWFHHANWRHSRHENRVRKMS